MQDALVWIPMPDHDISIYAFLLFLPVEEKKIRNASNNYESCLKISMKSVTKTKY